MQSCFNCGKSVDDKDILYTYDMDCVPFCSLKCANNAYGKEVPMPKVTGGNSDG